MLQIYKHVVDMAISVLMRLGLGDAVDGVAMAAAHLLSQRCQARVEEVLEQLRD